MRGREVCIVNSLKIGRPYDAKTWSCAHAVADYFGFEFDSGGTEWQPVFLYWMRRRFKPSGRFKGEWRSHIGELVTCRYTRHGGLHVGIVTEAGFYHAYRVPGKNGGDTVITAFNLMSTFHDIRFYRRVEP